MTTSSPPPIRLIAGPTASGKSALAIALAREIGGEIVNADSMQLYADLRLLTARPSADDEARAPHHLFGVADAADAWSVGRWLRAAVAALHDIASRGRPAVVVGGTGLYFRALTDGLAEIPQVPPDVRRATEASYAAGGERDFRERLSRIDPAAAARISPGDRQRLVRAYEVYVATSRALSDWRSTTPGPLSDRPWHGVVLDPPRAAVYRRCDERLAAMFDNGALDEVAALVARDLGPGLPAMKALGVAPIGAFLEGRLTRAEALAVAQQDTRRYAKRQLTWFRNQIPDWERSDGGAENPH